MKKIYRATHIFFLRTNQHQSTLIVWCGTETLSSYVSNVTMCLFFFSLVFSSLCHISDVPANMLFILLTSACMFVHVSSNILQHHAYHVTALDDLVFNGNMSLRDYEEVGFKAACAIYCGNEMACMAFSFHSARRHCKLYSAGFYDFDASVSDTGWQFYNFGDITCPLQDGFVHARRFDMCLLWWPDIADYAAGKSVCRRYNAKPISLTAGSKHEAFLELIGPIEHSFDVHVGLFSTGLQWQWENGEPYTGAALSGACIADCRCVVARASQSWMYEITSCKERYTIMCERQ